MLIRFVCPLGHRLAVPSHRAGKKGRCPVCNEKVVVPVPNPLEASADSGGAGEELAASDLGEATAPAPSAPAPSAPAPSAPISATASPAAASPAVAPATTPVRPPASPAIPGLGFRPGPARAAHAPPGKGTAPAQPAAAQPGPAQPATPSPAATPARAPLPAAAQPAALAAVPQVPQAATPQAAIPQAPASFESLPELKHLEAPGPEYSAAPTISAPKKPRASYTQLASKGKAQAVYPLGICLALVVLVSSLPALGYLNRDFIQAPGWARGIFLVAALQLVYIAWMMALPDWSTVWVGMWLFAVVAALYAMVLMIVLYTTAGKPLMLTLDDVRQTAKGWSMMMVLLMGLMSYVCGRVSMSWRKAFELAKAAKRPATA